MTRTERAATSHAWIADDVRVFTTAPDNLALYHKTNDNAWIASQAPTDLRNWR